jgi:peptide/nickel transport system substrate-binding protein
MLPSVTSVRCAAALLIAASACAPATPAALDSSVLVGRGSDVLALDPARITDSESAEVTEQIFDHLVRYRRDSTEIEPAHAPSGGDGARG